jgi:hypothetical protein
MKAILGAAAPAGEKVGSREGAKAPGKKELDSRFRGNDGGWW